MAYDNQGFILLKSYAIKQGNPHATEACHRI